MIFSSDIKFYFSNCDKDDIIAPITKNEVLEMKVTYDAAAKINLMLDILARLENGYHSLFMLMQSVDLYDTVTVDNLPFLGLTN